MDSQCCLHGTHMERTWMLSHVDSATMGCSRLGSSVHVDFPSKNTGVGCHFLLQGIFWTQGSNPCLLCLLHWQVDFLQLHHLGSHCLHIYLEITLNLQEKKKGYKKLLFNEPFRGSGYHSWTTLSYTTITEP